MFELLLLLLRLLVYFYTLIFILLFLWFINYNNSWHWLVVCLFYWLLVCLPRCLTVTDRVKLYVILFVFVAGLFVIFIIASNVGWTLTFTSFNYLCWTLALLLRLEINIQHNFSLPIILRERFNEWTLGEIIWVAGWVLVVLFTALFIFSYLINTWRGLRRK